MKEKITLKDFISNNEKIDNNKNNQFEIIEIELEKLIPYEKHIFLKLSEEKYEELKNSINIVGLQHPIVVRKKDYTYEILSGHNRVSCFRDLNLKTIPAIIKEYDDDVAELVVLDSNLSQRDDMLPCIKGQAYKRKLELLKKVRNKKLDFVDNNNSLEATTHSEQLYSIEKLSVSSNESRASIQRLIRLTELNEDLQNKVNQSIVPILAGVELSYVSNEEQDIVNSVIDNEKIKLTVQQAVKIREMKGEITYIEIENIVKGKPKSIKEKKFTGKIKKKAYKIYKDKFKDDEEFTDLVMELLEKHFNS